MCVWVSKCTKKGIHGRKNDSKISTVIQKARDSLSGETIVQVVKVAGKLISGGKTVHIPAPSVIFNNL